MSKEKCIPIKKGLVSYMASNFSDFVFKGSVGTFYAFQKSNEDGIYDYIIIQRDFYESMVVLVITEVTSCYNCNWRGIPWFTVGLGTDIGVLITGKNSYKPDVGWHKCNNKVEELDFVFSGIGSDINTFVYPYFSKCHEKIKLDKLLTTTAVYMKEQLTLLNEEEIYLIKQYLVDVNKAYSSYGKMCRKSNQKETLDYWDVIPLHRKIEQWLEDIKNQLKYSYLSDDIRIKIIKYTTVLFRDYFDFYNLK